MELSSKQIILGTAALSAGLIVVCKLLSPEGPVMSGRAKRLAEALFRNAGGNRPAAGSMHMPVVPSPELRELGAPDANGNRQTMTRRLYMQLRVLDVDLKVVSDFDKFFNDLKALLVKTPCVLYKDMNCSSAIALLSWSEYPAFFITEINRILTDPKVASKFIERKGWTMVGRTYSNGHEKDLEEYLFKKPIRNSTRDDWQWAVWYPLRREGLFYVQPPADQCKMLLHHAAIGKAFSEINAAHDIRLKSFGLDAEDNEYVVGLVGDDLHALSRVVEEMRKTRHTAEFLESLGPFFAGQKVWKSEVADKY